MNVGFWRSGKNTLFSVGTAPGDIFEKFVPGGYVSLGVLF
jgi:hypothetical protein